MGERERRRSGLSVSCTRGVVPVFFHAPRGQNRFITIIYRQLYLGCIQTIVPHWGALRVFICNDKKIPFVFLVAIYSK